MQLLSIVVPAYGAREQGIATANADKRRATAAALDASQKQIDMRQNMLKALAAQNAGGLGAIGTGGPTSFGANTRRQISQAQNDLLVSKANASGEISLLDQAASDAKAAGNIAAIGDLASGVSKTAGAVI